MRYKWFVLPAIGVIVLALGFVLVSDLGDNLVFYLTPTEAVEQRADFPDGERFRLGGQVSEGTVETSTDGVAFVITDGDRTINVVHTGAPPQLFQENIGVVVEGAWAGDRFESNNLIINHDEEYRYEDADGAYIPPTDN